MLEDNLSSKYVILQIIEIIFILNMFEKCDAIYFDQMIFYFIYISIFHISVHHTLEF